MKLSLDSIDFEKFKIDNLYASYLGMTSKEQTIAISVFAGLILLVVFLPITLATSSLSSLERSISKGKQDLKNIVREIDAYNSSQEELRALEASLSGGFDTSIATTLESLAQRAGIKGNIDSLKEKPLAPSENFEQASVDVRMRKVSLSDLIAFLFSIENHPSKILNLEKIEIKTRFKTKSELDASFTVSTFRLKEQ